MSCFRFMMLPCRLRRPRRCLTPAATLYELCSQSPKVGPMKIGSVGPGPLAKIFPRTVHRYHSMRDSAALTAFNESLAQELLHKSHILKTSQESHFENLSKLIWIYEKCLAKAFPMLVMVWRRSKVSLQMLVYWAVLSNTYTAFSFFRSPILL